MEDPGDRASHGIAASRVIAVVLALAVVATPQLVSAVSGPATYRISVSASPPGSGIVSESPALSAAIPRSGDYLAGSEVKISASKLGGYGFVGWNGTGPGSYTGTDSTAILAMKGNVTEVAEFAWNAGSAEFPVLPPNAPSESWTTTEVYGNLVGNLTKGTFTPSQMGTLLQMPISTSFEGVAGETGHVAYGRFNMEPSILYPWYPYHNAEFKLQLEAASVTSDTGLVRLAIATEWTTSTGATDYLEFDIWDSPNTIASMPNASYVYSRPELSPPTVEVKSAQIPVGVTVDYQLPVYAYFQKVYGTSATLASIYLVVEKTSSSSSFDIQTQFQMLRLW